MTQSNFGNPTQYEMTEIKIDDQDIIGLMQSLSIFEDIYTPCITGNIVIQDTDGAGFIEEQDLEFIEPITVKAKNANGDTLEFEGVLNGLRNEKVMGPTKLYVIDFSSETVRVNEQTFITKAFKETNPEEIVREMTEKLEGELDTNVRAKQMNYVASRIRPIDVIEYVCTHALTQATEATDKQNSDGKPQKEQAKGTTGFTFWETLKGFKFESIKDIEDGKTGEEHKDFKLQLANIGLSMEEAMKTIVEIQFDQIGDFQTKLRSGAFSSVNISFDLDTGIYKEYEYYNRDNMTPKQKEALPDDKFTRYFCKFNMNQKFNNEKQRSAPLTGDQSRAYIQQNSGSQNTFTDQIGEFTLYPQFNFSAGDVIDIKVAKVKDEEKADGGFDKKHSGKYIMQSVSHHFFRDGRAYTKVNTIRSTTQQDQTSAAKS